jgi:hypothetical protein
MILDQSKIESLPLELQVMLNEYVDFLFHKHHEEFSQKVPQKKWLPCVKRGKSIGKSASETVEETRNEERC